MFQWIYCAHFWACLEKCLKQTIKAPFLLCLLVGSYSVTQTCFIKPVIFMQRASESHHLSITFSKITFQHMMERTISFDLTFWQIQNMKKEENIAPHPLKDTEMCLFWTPFLLVLMMFNSMLPSRPQARHKDSIPFLLLLFLWQLKIYCFCTRRFLLSIVARSLLWNAFTSSEMNSIS